MLNRSMAELDALSWNEHMCREKAGTHRCKHDCKNCRYGEGQKLTPSERVLVMDMADHHGVKYHHYIGDVISFIVVALIAVVIGGAPILFCIWCAQKCGGR